MNVYHYFFIYAAVLCYIAVPIYKIYVNHKGNNDLLFSMITCYVLSFSIPIFYYYFGATIFSALLTFLLIIAAFLLLRDIKNIFGKYQVLSIPYFIFVVYTFSYFMNAIVTTC